MEAPKVPWQKLYTFHLMKKKKWFCLVTNFWTTIPLQVGKISLKKLEMTKKEPTDAKKSNVEIKMESKYAVKYKLQNIK